MKKIFLVIACLGLTSSLFAQNKIEDFSTSKDGVRYKMEKSNPKGRQLKEGDVIVGHFAVYFKDSMAFNNFNQPIQPCFAVTQTHRAFKGDLMDGLPMLHQGEVCMFAFPKDSMTKVQPLPPTLKSGDYVFYRVSVDSITTVEILQKEEAVKAKAEQKLADSLQLTERDRVLNYLKENNWSDINREGIYYHELVAGEGKNADSLDVVTINYTGQLLDGKVFDTSLDSVAKANNINQPGRKYEPLTFQIGAGQMIKGFEIAAKQMKKGGKAIVLLPSSLAYGGRRIGEIPPYSPLLFTLEMVDFHKGEPIPQKNTVQQNVPQIKVTPTTNNKAQTTVKTNTKTNKATAKTTKTKKTTKK
jgi:FKBP-type peptidyl-prolyl cis-trans isomerase FkpA